MKVFIECEPKEIAALVVAIQERQVKEFAVTQLKLPDGCSLKELAASVVAKEKTCREIRL